MPPRKYRIYDQETGNSFVMDWDSPQPPTDDDVLNWQLKQLAGTQTQPQQGFVRRAWDWANSPMWEGPTNAAKRVSDWLTTPELADSKVTAMAKGFLGGATEGAGQLISGLTSPLNAALTVASAGTLGATKAGLQGASIANRSIRGANKLAGAGAVVSGVDKIRQGDIGGGLVEAALGGAGYKLAGIEPQRLPVVESGPLPPQVKPIPGKMRLGPGQEPVGLLTEGSPLPDIDVPAVQPPPAEPPRFIAGMDRGTGQNVVAENKPYPINLSRAEPELWSGQNQGGMARTGDLLEAGEVNMVPPDILLGYDWRKNVPSSHHELWQAVFKEKFDLLADTMNLNPQAAAKYAAFWTDKEVLPPPANVVDWTPGEQIHIPRPGDPYSGPGNLSPRTMGEARNQAVAGDKTTAQQARAAFELEQNPPEMPPPPLVEEPLPSPPPNVNYRSVVGPGKEARKISKQNRPQGTTPTVQPVNAGSGGPVSRTQKWFGGHSSQPVFRSFQDWVNKRHAADVEGALARRNFQDLDPEGFEAVAKFQQGSRDGRLQDVANYFDTRGRQLQDAGVKFRWKEDYLPQIWDNPTPEQLGELNKRLGLNPSFTMRSLFETYEAGKAIGLKPKFQTVGDLVGWYEKTSAKALADREFFNYLRDNELIKRAGKAPRNWVELPPEHFPTVKTDKGNISWMTDPETANLINNYLKSPSPVLQTLADVAATGKNIALTSGIPFTGVNAHGYNILMRNLTAPRNPVANRLKGAYWLARPDKAKDRLEELLPEAPRLIKSGLMLSAEEFEPFTGAVGNPGIRAMESLGLGNTKVGAGMAKVLEKQEQWFADPLFKKILPTLKLEYAINLERSLKANGMGADEAARQASLIANNWFGGINWEQMGRHRDAQNLFRALILAPDWAETNLKIGGNVAKSLLNPSTPQGKAYLSGAAATIGAWLAKEVYNQQVMGTSSLEEHGPQPFNVKLGTSAEGNSIEGRPFGTSSDWLRLPIEIAIQASKGRIDRPLRIIEQRMSVPAAIGTRLVTNVDERKNPILGRDRFGRDVSIGRQVGNFAEQLPGGFTPQYMQAWFDYLQGESEPWEALFRGTETPISYYNLPSPAPSVGPPTPPQIPR